MKLLSTGNPKILKGMSQGYMTYILHLAPASLSGYNTCPKATEGCKAACLNTAGRGGMFKKGENTNVIQQARIRKTKMFFEDRIGFMLDLVKDIELGLKQAAKKNMIPVFRLNGTSDLAWEKYQVVRNGKLFRNIFAAFPDVQFYDYTKVPKRVELLEKYNNYDLTFSYSGYNSVDCVSMLNNGVRVAVVFKKVPDMFWGRKVIDGDAYDMRYYDEKDVIVGLKYKRVRNKLEKEYKFVIQ